MKKFGHKSRQILLIEPRYKNKYPPIGLMKIATYHKMLGDQVIFYKGDVKTFIIDKLTQLCYTEMKAIDNIHWDKKTIARFIRVRHKKVLLELLSPSDTQHHENLTSVLRKYAKISKDKTCNQYICYDRVYITTLFTFYWNITIEAIEQAKLIVSNINNLKVGGILASLLAKEVEKETKIKPMQGLLDQTKALDNNSIIIDDLPLDYSILDEVDYEYPTGSAYFTFMTKGCTRKCKFCSVPKLEPTYKPKIPTKDKFEETKEKFGEQQHLLLMDNNVLGSPNFPEIIQEIKEMGFVKGAKFVEPNQLDIAIKNLKKGINDVAYINRCFSILSKFRHRCKNKKDIGVKVEKIIIQYKLSKKETVKKESLIFAYNDLKDIYEKYRNKIPKKRYVDFNQGLDARYINEENIKLLSEIPIYPLRIAFDYIGIKRQYEEAVRLSAKYNITRLSNYLLFNFKDKPIDLFRRMELNIDLSEELNIHIYSFPMKYIPLFGEEAKHRNYIGQHWNKKFIRAIQAISNVTRGIVPPGRSFFELAYGKNETEFMELLYMPESYLIYRSVFTKLGYIDKWRKLFISLNEKELSFAKDIIESNIFDNPLIQPNAKVVQLLQHYKITRKDIKENTDKEYKKVKQKFDRMINNDQFMDATLTYDSERRKAV